MCYFPNWLGFSYHFGQQFRQNIIVFLLIKLYQYPDWQSVWFLNYRSGDNNNYFLHLSKLYQFQIHISNSLTEESIATKRLFKNKSSRSALYTQFTVEIDRLHLYMLWRLAPHSRRAANWRHNTHTFTPPTKFLISKIYTELIALLVARKLCIQSCKKNL